MATVAHLFRAPMRRVPMEELTEARFVEAFGIEGCVHGRAGSKRQVLMVDRETLDAMDLKPGILRENITTWGLNVNGLAPGEKLKIGETVLEVAAVCTPCDQMEKIRKGLRKELWGRRGMLCRVLQGGLVRPGDPIERLPETGASGKDLEARI